MLNYQDIEQADDGEYRLVTPISAARFMLPYWNPYNVPTDRSLRSTTARGRVTGRTPWSGSKNNQPRLQEIQTRVEPLRRGDHHRGADLQVAVQRRLLPHDRVSSSSAPSYAPNLGRGQAPSACRATALTLSVTNTLNYQFRVNGQARVQLPARPGGRRLPLRGTSRCGPKARTTTSSSISPPVPAPRRGSTPPTTTMPTSRSSGAASTTTTSATTPTLRCVPTPRRVSVPDTAGAVSGASA